jgi:Zinc-binding dehydrogenase
MQEQNERFGVLHTRRPHPLAETLREPLAVTVRNGPRRVTEIASPIDEEIIRPVVDRVFPFASTNEAMAYVEAGRVRGKVVVSLKVKSGESPRHERRSSRSTAPHHSASCCPRCRATKVGGTVFVLAGEMPSDHALAE